MDTRSHKDLCHRREYNRRPWTSHVEPKTMLYSCGRMALTSVHLYPKGCLSFKTCRTYHSAHKLYAKHIYYCVYVYLLWNKTTKINRISACRPFYLIRTHHLIINVGLYSLRMTQFHPSSIWMDLNWDTRQARSLGFSTFGHLPSTPRVWTSGKAWEVMQVEYHSF